MQHENSPVDGEAGLDNLDAVFSRPHVATRLRAAAPTAHTAAEKFWQAAFCPSALSARMKELVLVALHATVTALDSEGVRRHVGRALTAGASQQDVLDVLITIVGAANHALYFAVPVLMRELQAAGHPQAELPQMTERARATKEAFVRTRGFWNEQRDIIVRLMPEYFDALSQISTESWKNGTLTAKERELVCIAIDCSVTHMYEPGLAIHIRNALKQGATREEILDVFHLASLTGLEGYILGVEAMLGAPAHPAR